MFSNLIQTFLVLEYQVSRKPFRSARVPYPAKELQHLNAAVCGLEVRKIVLSHLVVVSYYSIPVFIAIERISVTPKGE